MERGNLREDVHASCRQEIAVLHAMVAELKAENAGLRQLRVENAALKERVEHLEWRLNQNSRNSSMPPSSDAPSAPPRPKKPPTGRKPGGQPGHEGHEREFLPLAEVDKVVALKPKRCRRCRQRLSGEDADPLRHQVVEIPPVQPQVTEYRRHRLICKECGETTTAELPPGIPEGMVGPRLRAMIGYLSGKAHQSKRMIREMLRDLLGVNLSVGTIKKVEEAVSGALEAPVQEAHAYVQQQKVANADETSWWQRNRLTWLWVARTMRVTVFLIHPSRGAQAARELLGRFAGYLGTDRWGGYNGWAIRMRQMCWAHLIRDFRGFVERGKGAGPIGEALLGEVQKMFSLWHRVRDGTLARSTFRKHMGPIRRRVGCLLRAGVGCGETKTQGMCRKILQVEPALWTFVRIEGVEPTNNAAERAIRPAVLYRKRCLGTQSAEGSRFVERMLTVVTTLRQQNRDILVYLTQACQAAQTGKLAPSLLPDLRRGTMVAA